MSRAAQPIRRNALREGSQSARRNARRQGSASGLTRESRPRLIYCGLLWEGNDHLLANVDGKWLGEGDSIQSTGGRIEIERITADHLVTFRNGVRRWVRFGESLEPEPAELPRYAPDRDPRLDQFAAGAMPAWGVP